MSFNKTCPLCGCRFSADREARVFCSAECRTREYAGRSYKNYLPGEMCSGTVGALAETMVSADLLRKGFGVFRPISPASPCDLIIMRGDLLRRVEVTIAYRTPAGRTRFATWKTWGGGHDILALVFLQDETIEYRPHIEQVFE